MTFKELKELLFWACDNGQNIDDLAFLGAGKDGQLINEALRDLADCLNIVKYTTTLTPDGSGKVTLPSDFVEALRVKYGDTDLTPITNVFDAAIGSGSVTQYMFTGRQAIQLYDVPALPYSTLYMWYRAYPTGLVNDTDEPTDVPREYHETLATVYGKAQFVKKFGDIAQYQQLMGLWSFIKKEIRGKLEVRAQQGSFPVRWEW